MTTTTLTIDGMSCGHCVKAVQSALDGIAGARVERVDIGTATIRHDATHVPAAELIAAVNAEGYDARVVGER